MMGADIPGSGTSKSNEASTHGSGTSKSNEAGTPGSGTAGVMRPGPLELLNNKIIDK